MYYKFDCEDKEHGRAALILYAVYKSRDKTSSVAGKETWDRFSAYIKAACLKSENTAQFVQELCHKTKTNSIKPLYLDDGAPVALAGTHDLIVSDDFKNYRLDVLADDNLMEILKKESIYLLMLVRERIQRERTEQNDEDND